MNHYELVFIVNPQLSKDSKLFDKCKEQITSINGILHRAEDIGLRDLAYQIAVSYTHLTLPTICSV